MIARFFHTNAQRKSSKNIQRESCIYKTNSFMGFFHEITNTFFQYSNALTALFVYLPSILAQICFLFFLNPLNLLTNLDCFHIRTLSHHTNHCE